MHANPDEFEGYGPLPPEPQGEPGEVDESDDIKGHWDKRLTTFQKLMFIKIFKTEKVRWLPCWKVYDMCQTSISNVIIWFNSFATNFLRNIFSECNIVLPLTIKALM